MSIDRAHADHVHEHPTWKQYKWVALWLFVITVIEVWAYYIPSFVASAAFKPALLLMSAIKFAVVVMYYMHLKFDHPLFRKLFIGPMIIAGATLIAFLFLFGNVRIG
jgi:cytochrome c oxidase subunit 4